MKLQSLGKFGKAKGGRRAQRKAEADKDLRALLGRPKKLLKVVQDELMVIRGKYSDQRRTKVVARISPNDVR